MATNIYGLAGNTTYHYRVVAQNGFIISYGLDNIFTTKDITSVGDEQPLPGKFYLDQNYPNPFNPQTVISYILPEGKYVKLIVLNLLGQEVARLVDGQQDAGVKSVTFDGGHLSSGIYFYKLQAGTFIAVKKMLLMR